MTAPVGIRIGREFLEPFGALRLNQSFHHVLAFAARSWRRVCCCFGIELCESRIGCSYGRAVLACCCAAASCVRLLLACLISIACSHDCFSTELTSSIFLRRMGCVMVKRGVVLLWPSPTVHVRGGGADDTGKRHAVDGDIGECD